ncbi:MAG TPA: hypothetical protein VFS31_02185, partial [Chitinophagaceae bacterium]|nr:hypothetical protein [Chitinophagaceae bacterium]
KYKIQGYLSSDRLSALIVKFEILVEIINSAAQQIDLAEIVAGISSIFKKASISHSTTKPKTIVRLLPYLYLYPEPIFSHPSNLLS